MKIGFQNTDNDLKIGLEGRGESITSGGKVRGNNEERISDNVQVPDDKENYFEHDHIFPIFWG